jgi:hypothetical protein
MTTNGSRCRGKAAVSFVIRYQIRLVVPRMQRECYYIQEFNSNIYCCRILKSCGVEPPNSQGRLPFLVGSVSLMWNMKHNKVDEREWTSCPIREWCVEIPLPPIAFSQILCPVIQCPYIYKLHGFSNNVWVDSSFWNKAEQKPERPKNLSYRAQAVPTKGGNIIISPGTWGTITPNKGTTFIY